MTISDILRFPQKAPHGREAIFLGQLCSESDFNREVTIGVGTLALHLLALLGAVGTGH